MVGLRRGAFTLAAFVALLIATVAFASATTYKHGKTVWFSDQTIGAGDSIGGDLDIVYGSVTCEDGATIHGSVRTFFGSFDQRDGCDVEGRVVDAFGKDSIDAYVPWMSPNSDDFFGQNRGLANKFAWDVVVVLAFLLFPFRARIALERVERHPGLCGATGAAALVAALPVAVLLLLSIIGLPLIPLEIAALFAGAWIGFAAVALLIGRRMYELVWPHTTPSPLTALVVGLGAALLAFVRESAFRSDGFTAVRPGSPPPGSGPPANRIA